MRCPTNSELPPPATNKIDWPWTAECPPPPSRTPDDKLWPKISIVTPSYNQGQYLEETIRSVILQGYPNLEYIIIDGGSTDDSVEIIKKYSRWIEYWVSEPDSGQAAAINKGFQVASGDILAWLNSDDLYLQGALFEIGAYFLKNKDVDLVYGGCIKISSEGETLRTEKAVSYNFQNLLMHNVIAQPSTFFKHTFFERAGPLNEKMDYCFDVELWVKGSLQFKYKNHHDLFSKFRYHSDSKTVAHNLRMSKEAAEATIGVLEKNETRNDTIRKCIRLRYVNLAVWQWRIDKKDTKRIQAYLDKANINHSLFDIGSVSHIVRPFLDFKFFQSKRSNYRLIKSRVADMLEFHRQYLQLYFGPDHDIILKRLLGYAYLKISLKKKNPYFFIKAILYSPRYTVQLIFLQLKKVIAA